jgi:hypothetical protein
MLCGLVDLCHRGLCTKLFFKNVSKHVLKKETPARDSHDPPRMGSGNGGKMWLTGVEALGDGGGIAKDDAAAEAAGDERRDPRAAHHHHLTFIVR